jgi:hypothetical protein
LKKFLLAMGVSLALSTAASASVIPVLESVTPDGADWTFSYSGTLAGDQGLMDGSELVIFDFKGYVPGSISAGIYASDVATSVELTTPLPTLPGITDDPTIPNLVFTWIGAPFNTSGGPFSDITFAGLTADSTLGGVGLDGFSALAVVNNGAATGNLAFNTGTVGVPAAGIPEPSSWALMMLGVGLLGVSLRTRQRLAVA